MQDISLPSHSQQKSIQEKNTKQSNDLRLTKIVLIGSSTGGPGLIEQICSSLLADYKYPICIVQHMPEKFTATFVTRLKRISVLPAHETSQNMALLPGNIYVARGGVHMNFTKKVSGKIVICEDNDKGENFFQPSVNEMMFSALKVFNAKDLVGVVLTGIGDDGADAMIKLKAAGAYTLGESEESATVYGMPKEAYDRNGVMEQLDFKQILKRLVNV